MEKKSKSNEKMTIFATLNYWFRQGRMQTALGKKQRRKQGLHVVPMGDPKMTSKLNQGQYPLAVSLLTKGQTQNPGGQPDIPAHMSSCDTAHGGIFCAPVLPEGYLNLVQALDVPSWEYKV